MYFLKIEFKMVQFSKGQAIAIAMSQPFEHWTIQNPDIFVWISNDFWQNGSHLSRFQIVGLSDFKSHLKFRPFAIIFNHSKFGLVQISDPICIYLEHYLELLDTTLYSIYSLLDVDHKYEHKEIACKGLSVFTSWFKILSSKIFLFRSSNYI